MTKYLTVSFYLLLALTLIFGVSALYVGLVVAPPEKTMGAIQRIMYFHVGSAFAAYTAIGVVFLSSIAYIGTRNSRISVWNKAAGELGLLFCSIVLFTGMVWGNVAWNTPLRFEPRLVSFLLLWFVFLSFVLLRFYGDQEKVALHCSVLGIVGTIFVPLMIYSIQLLPQSAQLHPQVSSQQGFREPEMIWGLGLASITLILLQFCLLILRVRIEYLQKEQIPYGS